MYVERSGGRRVTASQERNRGSRLAALRVVPDVSAAAEISDRDLVALLRAGDERGFAGAYARYAQRIFGFLVRLARSRAVAEDLFQHTFLRLAERGSGLRADSELRAWLFSVARNAFHSHARAQALEARADRAADPSASGALVESGLVLNELEAALGSLTTDDRELLLLVGVEGLSPAEVAELLAVDTVTLRKRLSRARVRLADALDSADTPVSKSEIGR
jgi:RNA polymerase sigma-70 factor (ECF subfamily)